MAKTKRPAVVYQTSSSATLESQEASQASADKITSCLNTIKKKKTKSKSKAKIINHENDLKLNDDESDDDQEFDLQTCMEESGGLEQFS